MENRENLDNVESGENECATIRPVPKKTKYLARTLSRTKRKDFENYVLNAVWNRLGMYDVQPVSQQLVVCGDSHYFIDLYFPQINFGVECDEPYHQSQIEQDRHRLANIEETFNTINQTSSYRCCRINLSVDKSEEVERQINQCVDTIRRMVYKSKKDGTFVPWTVDGREYPEYFADKNSIHADDDIEFPTIVAACNTLFGTEYTTIRRGCFRPSTFTVAGYDKYVVWFPKLAVEGTPTNANWNNTISMDHQYIYERPTEALKNDTNFHSQYGQEVDLDGVRFVTFLYMRDPVTRESSYRFAGVYQTVEFYPEGGDVRKQISESFPLIRPEQ